MTHQYAKTIRKKLLEPSGLAHKRRGLGSVVQFISLYCQEGNPRGQSLKNKGEYTGH